MTTSAIIEACKKAGGQSALARAIGCSPQAVQRMCATGRVPAERVLQIEKASGVSRHELRPDIYPAEGEVAGVGAPATALKKSAA